MNSRSHDVLSRRQASSLLLAGLTATAATGVAAAAETLVGYLPGATRFTRIDIDTRPMAAKGLTNYARRVSDMAQPIVRRVFADRLEPGARGGMSLVIRIDSIQLSEPGREGTSFRFPSFGSENRDWIEGAGSVLGRGRQTLTTVPVTTSNSSNDGPPGDRLANERFRTAHLVELLALWVKQKV